MDSFDSSDFTIIPTTGTRLLSESPLLRPDLGSKNGDLSLSELSLSNNPDRTEDPPSKHNPEADDLHDHLEQIETEEVDSEEEARMKRQAAKTREEKLQHDLFLLRRLNGAFALYTDALRATQSSTERLKARLKDTNALLDKYVGMLDRSEAITKLILDERWHGADADEEHIQRQQGELEEKLRKEAEERELAEQRERERVDREVQEKQERVERMEQEKIEREKREKKPVRGGPSSSGASISGSGVRGVRGTRASMRARGVVRGSSTTASSQNTTRIGRPSSTTSARGSTTYRARARGS